MSYRRLLPATLLAAVIGATTLTPCDRITHSANSLGINQSVSSIPEYSLENLVAEHYEHFEDRIWYHVRFYDTRLINKKFKLRTEKEIMEFRQGSNYNIVEVIIMGSEHPSAIIYHDIDANTMIVRQYLIRPPQKPKLDREYSYPLWDPAIIGKAAKRILEDLGKY